MAGQERAAKVAKKAKVKAEAVIREAREAAKLPATLTRGPLGDARIRPSGKPVKDEKAQADAVKALRDEGRSWMAIGKELGLPGVRFGAATARALYRRHHGNPSDTSVVRARRPAKERGGEAKASSVRARPTPRTQARQGAIPEEATDAEVLAMLANREIKWDIDIAKLSGGKGDPQYVTEEAQVHPSRDLLMIETIKGERCVRFKEVQHTKKGLVAGPTRTVRLAAIHTIR